MTYIVTVTSQGQISIPAPIRKTLGVDKYKKAIVRLDKDTVTIKPVPDIMDLKGIFKSKKRFTRKQEQEAFEKFVIEEFT